MRSYNDTECVKTSFNEDFTVATPINPSIQASIEIDESSLLNFIDESFDHQSVVEQANNPAINSETKSISCDYTVHQVKKLCQASQMLLKHEEDKVTVHHIKSGRNGRFTVDFKFASKQYCFKFRI